MSFDDFAEVGTSRRPVIVNDAPRRIVTAPPVIVAAGTTVKVFPDDPDRFSFTLTNCNGTSGNVVWVGDENVGVNRGDRVAGNYARNTGYSNAVWVHNPMGVDIILALSVTKGFY